jgi:hypothetical protein
VQHLQAGVAESAAVAARLARGAVEVTRPVPEARGGLLGQRGEPDGGGDGTAPDRPGRPTWGLPGRGSAVGWRGIAGA